MKGMKKEEGMRVAGKDEITSRPKTICTDAPRLLRLFQE